MSRKRRTKRRKGALARNRPLLAVAGVVVIVVLGIMALMAVGREVRSGSATDLPDFVRAAGPDVEAAYQGAIKYKDEFSEIRCYCGCDVSVGHDGLADCHIADERADGIFVFDEHSRFCGICIGEALDATQWLDEGVSLEEVKARIDARWGP